MTQYREVYIFRNYPTIAFILSIIGKITSAFLFKLTLFTTSRAETRYCEGVYRFYDDYQPSCFRSISHGEVNVVTALKHSCNIFFFDVGRIAGIDTLNSYSAKLGFGKKTGIELPGEMSGIIAGRKYRESIGKTWEDGETLLAAIGQSDNAVTPVQLVNYVATIGNGGIDCAVRKLC